MNRNEHLQKLFQERTVEFYILSDQKRNYYKSVPSRSNASRSDTSSHWIDVLPMFSKKENPYSFMCVQNSCLRTPETVYHKTIWIKLLFSEIKIVCSYTNPKTNVS